ncbi:HAD family phosphatase [Quadrisphaera sp. DSM 44207]|uniref:HAD family hydrolase n=1 Tax=Quadrisphaera sp. DSM 44207 TaxID=1881057 RepID=UPI00087E1A29|nr:HAD family phosphatase [Quadrisphaera sp. DSM 44207]SDQ15523.1 sugar-phosphatase [Quadrisphaera sp. DSM 44207]
MRALLLDLDGTLVDSEPAHRAAWRAFFASRGWHVDEDTYRRTFVGRRGADVLATEPGPWAGEDPRALVEEVLSHLRETARLARAAPGAGELLRRARAAGVALALVTSATRAWVDPALRQVLGVDAGAFDAEVTAESVAQGKPHPAPFALACSLLGVPPAEAVAVEDSASGVRSAVAAGVGRVVGVETTTSADLLRDAGATQVVAHLDQVDVGAP